MSDAVLRALLSELPGTWRMSVTRGGNVSISLHWMEWTGMGSEEEREIAFFGPREDVFRWLCKRVNESG